VSATRTHLGHEVDRELAAAGRRGHRSLVAGVVRDGDTVVRGWAADGPAPDATTLFEIGSVTKVFTGVLLADMHLTTRSPGTCSTRGRRGGTVSRRCGSWPRTGAVCRTRRGRCTAGSSPTPSAGVSATRGLT
jgi:hypothetical protein